MLITLIQKEMMHHILSVRFVAPPFDVFVARPTHALYQISTVSSESGRLSGGS